MRTEQLPAGWTRVKFGDVVHNCNENTRDLIADGIDRVVGLDHLDSGSLRLVRWDYLADLPDGTTFTRKFKPGQVLFGKRRAYQRKVAVPDFDGVCSGDILVFEPADERMLTEFLPYVVQSDGFFDHALGTSAGSLSPRTKWAELAKYEFALPPVDEQQRIVEILTAADAHVSSLERQGSAARTARSAVLSELLSAGGDDWTEIVLGEAVKIQKGKKPPELIALGLPSHPYLTADVLRGATCEQFVLEEHMGACIALNGHETLLLWDGAGAGDVFKSQPGVLASTMAKLEPRDSNLIEDGYLFLYLNSMQAAIKSSCRGTTVPHVSPEALKSLALPLPPLIQQHRIVDMVSRVDAVIRSTELAVVEAKNLRSGLLSVLLAGEDS